MIAKASSSVTSSPMYTGKMSSEELGSGLELGLGLGFGFGFGLG
jgi:hypothetical protein